MKNELFPIIKNVKKVWGAEFHLHNTTDFCTKILTLNQGCCCSIHWHKIKRELFVMQTGQMLVEIWDRLPEDYNLKCTNKLRHILPQRFVLSAVNLEPQHGVNYIFIPPYTPHRFTGLSAYGASFVECSTQDFETDSYRATLSQGAENRLELNNDCS